MRRFKIEVARIESCKRQSPRHRPLRVSLFFSMPAFCQVFAVAFVNEENSWNFLFAQFFSKLAEKQWGRQNQTWTIGWHGNSLGEARGSNTVQIYLKLKKRYLHTKMPQNVSTDPQTRHFNLRNQNKKADSDCCVCGLFDVLFPVFLAEFDDSNQTVFFAVRIQHKTATHGGQNYWQRLMQNDVNGRGKLAFNSPVRPQYYVDTTSDLCRVIRILFLISLLWSSVVFTNWMKMPQFLHLLCWLHPLRIWLLAFIRRQLVTWTRYSWWRSIWPFSAMVVLERLATVTEEAENAHGVVVRRG